MSKCRPTPFVLRSDCRGFTLLEMLVVLALMALVAGVALPNFDRMLASFTASTKWSKLIAELDGLPHRAWSRATPIRLDADNAARVLESLPGGWKLKVESAGNGVLYRDNGWCDGGRITLVTDTGATRSIDLVAPRCAVNVS